MTNWMEELDQKWEETTTKSSEKAGARVPEGKQRAVAKSIEFDEEARAIRYKMAFPDAGDRELGKTTFLFDKDGNEKFDWAKNEMACLGEANFKLSEIKEACARAQGRAVNVTVHTPEGRKYSNIYFNSPASSEPSDVTTSWG